MNKNPAPFEKFLKALQVLVCQNSSVVSWILFLRDTGHREIIAHQEGSGVRAFSLQVALVS